MQPTKAHLIQLATKLEEGLWERGDLIRLCLLALLSGEHIFLYGPPGTAKSLIARRLHLSLEESTHFEYLMGRFSVPEEIFGPFSLQALKEKDSFQRKTQGYLPESTVAFLDEIWRSSSPIQNTLLTLLNEKIFRNGNQEFISPLQTLVAAANTLPPQDEDHQAIWDRFLFRIQVDPLQERENFLTYLKHPQQTPQPQPQKPLKKEDLEIWAKNLEFIPFPDELGEFFFALRQDLEPLKEEGLLISDRRWKKAARALLSLSMAENESPGLRHLFLLEHLLWNKGEQKSQIRGALIRILEETPPSRDLSWEEVQKEYQSLQDLSSHLFLTEQESEEWVPSLVDGEYHVFEGLLENQEIRIWKEEWEQLPWDEEKEIELIFTDPLTQGVRIQNQRAAKTSTKKPGLTINNEFFSLKGRKKKIIKTLTLKPSDQDQENWQSRLKSFQNRLLSIQKGLDKEKNHLRETNQSRFLPIPDYWLETLEDQSKKLEQDYLVLLADLETLGK